MAKKHECNCDHCAKKQSREGGGGVGFTLGVAIGAAAAALTAPDAGKRTRDKAKAKLDELTGGKTPEQLLGSVKQVAEQVVTEIKGGVAEGKKEAAKEKRRILRDD